MDYRKTPTPVPVKTPSADVAEETDADYESDFEIDKEGPAKVMPQTENEDEYENDSFIIDDDGRNKDGDLTGSSVSALSPASPISDASIAESMSRESESKVSN